MSWTAVRGSGREAATSAIELARSVPRRTVKDHLASSYSAETSEQRVERRESSSSSCLRGTQRTRPRAFEWSRRFPRRGRTGSLRRPSGSRTVPECAILAEECQGQTRKRKFCALPLRLDWSSSAKFYLRLIAASLPLPLRRVRGRSHTERRTIPGRTGAAGAGVLITRSTLSGWPLVGRGLDQAGVWYLTLWVYTNGTWLSESSRQ